MLRPCFCIYATLRTFDVPGHHFGGITSGQVYAAIP